MQQPFLADHLLAAALAALSLALASGKLTQRSVEDRASFYKSAIASSLALPIAGIALWVASGRQLESFGMFGWLGNGRMTLALGTAWIAMLAVYVVVVGCGVLREHLRPIYTRLAGLMPTNRRELAASWVVSTFAGCGEEIVYRGFLLWYVSSIIGVPGALVIVSLLFGAAHGYQSRWGMTFASLAGLVLGGIYLASGSLLLVMWAHATYNMASFFIGGMIVLRDQECSTPHAANS